MNIGHLFLGSACAIVAPLISVYIAVFPLPEAWSATSSDTFFHVSGDVYESQRFFITERTQDTLQTYTINPLYAHFPSPLTVIVTPVDDGERALYRLHEEKGY